MGICFLGDRKDGVPALRPTPRPDGPRARGSYVFAGAAYPHTAGVPAFNQATVTALRDEGACEYLSWRRLYPPGLYRGAEFADPSPPPRVVDARAVLDWHRPDSWRRVGAAARQVRARAIVLPWLHPVMALQYRAIMASTPRDCARVVICHNVRTHESVPGLGFLTRFVLSQADLLVLHDPVQEAQLEEIGLSHAPRVVAFLPRLVAEDLAPIPTTEEVQRTRAALIGGADVLLLSFGTIRAYKGIDVLVEALGRRAGEARVRVVIAGKAWIDIGDLRARADELGLQADIVWYPDYVSSREAAILALASDGFVLPYRSASASGVIALAFAYGRPVIATHVGGIPGAVRPGIDSVLCEPGDPDSLAHAIADFANNRERLQAGVQSSPYADSFERYGALIEDGLSRHGR